MSTTQVEEAKTDTKPLLTFPPFPTPPSGATIVPFSQFRPLGIAVAIDDDKDHIEVDGLGVPTVTLQSRHDLTEEERKMGKKKVSHATIVTPDGQVRRLTWQEEWLSHEKSHKFSYDQRESVFDRLWQASNDFKTSRAWPASTNPLLNLWDHIRLYIGLIASIQPPPSKRKKNLPIPEDQEDDDEDGDAGEPKPVSVERVDDPVEGMKMATERNEKAREESTSGQWDEATLEAFREKRDEKKDERKVEFLYDTEKSVQIFFSAHFRDKGLGWDKLKSQECPPLMAFFLRFLINYNVFREPEITRGLQRAITVCDQAEVDLPATFVVAPLLPDAVSKKLQQHYGEMTNSMGWGNYDSGTDDGTANDESTEPDTKKRKVDGADGVAVDADVININSNEVALDEAALRDAITDNVDVNGVEVAPTGIWGNSVEQTGAEWGAPTSTSNAWWDDDNGKSDEQSVNQWAIKEDTSLSNLLGETADLLPTLFTTGLAERSTRRLVKVVKPSGIDSELKGKEDSVQAVEAELESKLAYMVLAPWKKIGNHIASDVVAPIIQDSSRGPVVPVLAKGQTSTEPLAPGAFDPRKDEIYVLLDPATCDKLTVGLGLTATWIQLVRKADDDGSKSGDGSGKKRKNARKGGPGANGEPTKWWYMEQCMSPLVSFHADRYYPDQD